MSDIGCGGGVGGNASGSQGNGGGLPIPSSSSSSSSSTNNNNNNNNNNNTAKGGKNLAMMQQLFEKQHPQTNESISGGTVPNPIIKPLDATSSDASSLLVANSNSNGDETVSSSSNTQQQQQGIHANRPGKSADQVMAALSRMQQPETKSLPSETNASSASVSQHSNNKPRGKNFDQMVKANHMPLKTHVETTMEYISPSPMSLPSIPIQATTATSPAPPVVAVKARGKDFQAMIQRAPEEIQQNLPPFALTTASMTSHPLPSSTTTVATKNITGSSSSSSTGISNPIRRMNSNPVWSAPGTERVPYASTTHHPSMMGGGGGGGPVSFYGFHHLGDSSSNTMTQQTHSLTYPHNMAAAAATMGPPLSLPIHTKQQPPKPKRIKTTKPTGIDANMFARTATNTTTPALEHSNTTPTNTTSKQQQSTLLLGPKISTLLATVDPTGLYTLEEETEEQILHLVHDFVNSVVQQSIKLAKHRCTTGPMEKGAAVAGGGGGQGNSTTPIVNVHDVALALKKGWGMTIPGFGSGTTTTTLDTPSQWLASGPASRILSHTHDSSIPPGITKESVENKARELAQQMSSHDGGGVGMKRSADE